MADVKGKLFWSSASVDTYVMAKKRLMNKVAFSAF